MSPTLSFLLEHVGSQLEVLEEMSNRTDNLNSTITQKYMNISLLLQHLIALVAVQWSKDHSRQLNEVSVSLTKTPSQLRTCNWPFSFFISFVVICEPDTW